MEAIECQARAGRPRGATVPKFQKVDQPLYHCPDCPTGQPISRFYVGEDGKRATYCKTHHNRRNAARQADRLNPESPNYDPDFHKRRTSTWGKYHRRKLDPKSPEYDKALHERQLAAKSRWYDRNRRKTPREAGE